MISKLITRSYLQNYESESESEIRGKYLHGHECERSSVQNKSKAKAKATKILRGINFTLISVSTLFFPRFSGVRVSKPF